MRIINLLQKPQLRGTEIFACQLSTHLMTQGHEVLVVTIFKGTGTLPYEGPIKHLGRPIDKRFLDLRGWRAFQKICRDFQPDIVQANAADTLKFAVSSRLWFRWKSKIVFRNASKIGDLIDSKLKFKANNFYLSKVDFVISVSEECHRDFIETFPYPPEKVVTVEIGVEEKTIGGIPEDLEPLFAAGPVLVNIASFVPEKNHAGLIRILETVVQTQPNAQLALIGLGKLQESIRESVRKKGLAGQVHFLGHRHDVMEVLQHASLFTIPSLIEGLPAIVLEAMYCETPVVAYNVGGIGEVVTAETGWLIEKGDEDGFAKAVCGVLQNPGQAAGKIRKAKQRVQNHFLNTEITKRFIAVYQHVLAFKKN